MSRAMLAALLGLCGCISFGEGSGEIRGNLVVPRCTVSATGQFDPGEFPEFDLAPTWFFGERVGDVLELRIQRDSRGLHLADGLVLQVRDVSLVSAGAALEIRPDLEPYSEPAAPVRLSLSLKGSCDRDQSSLVGRGTITFSRFDPADNGIVEANFSVEIVDVQQMRLGQTPTVIGNLQGSFSMTLHLVAEPG